MSHTNTRMFTLSGFVAVCPKLYQQAAEQGNASAQLKLGFRYANGIGVEKDVEKAVELYQQAAKQGHANAQNKLGSLLIEMEYSRK